VFQDFLGNALFQFSHCPDFVSAEITADGRVILRTMAKIEAVPATLGAVQFDAHFPTRNRGLPQVT
jgi:hypothetical protein